MPAATRRPIARLLLPALAAVALLGACSEDEPTLPTQTSAPTTAAAPTSISSETLRCETQGFTPNSEDAASEVTATGLSCPEAEAFVRSAGQRTSAGGPSSVQVDGYRCVAVRTQEDPLPRTSYECKNDAKTVTFVRS